MISSYEYTHYIWPMFTGTGLCAALGIYSWRHRNVPGATGLAFIMLFTVVRLMASILEVTAGDFSTKVFSFQIEEFCLLPITVSGLAFALGYAGLDTRFSLRTYVLTTTPLLFFIPLSFTNNAHHLIWTQIWLDGRIHFTPGVFNYGMMSYGILLTVVTVSIFIGLFIQSPLQRWPVGLILVNMFTGRTLYFLGVAGVDPIKLFGPFELASNFICLIYFVALFHFRLFTVLPVARTRAIEQMHDGMLVLDAETRIVDLNGGAQELLGVAKSKVIGRDAAQVLLAHPELLELVRKPDATEDEIWVGEGRCYRVHITPLANHRGFELGKLIIFYDTSEEKRTQKQLQDHQRKLASLEEREWLARELHDGVGQALAAAHLQVKTASELLARGQVTATKISLDQLIEVIREGKAHVGDYLFGVKTWSSSDQFFTGLRQYVMNYRQNGGIRTDLVIPPEIERNPLEEAIETQLHRIIQEAMTNIRKHAHARSARVIFSLDGEEVKIMIEDDGQGFDAAALGDNHGFGLRSMKGRAEAVGARLELKSSPGNGTQVIVRVPWRKEEP
jgi:PAS domain S-box-containing protein